MSDEPNDIGAAPESADLKAELLRKVQAKGLKADARFSIARLEAMLSEADAEAPAVSAPVPDVVEPPANAQPEGAESVEALKARLAEMAALLASKAAPAPAPPVFVPAKAPEAPPPPPPGEKTVQCRVTKAGHLKIFTGLEDPVHYKWGEIIYVPVSAAAQLEAKLYIEIGEPG
jgi:hypothetical protein